MKVLHLISSSGMLGAERVILELAEYLRKEGVDVTIGVFENKQNPNLELADYAREKSFDVQVFPCKGRLDKKTIHLIKNYIETEGVQILHSHNYKSNFYAWRAINNNIRWVVTNHGRRFGFRLSIYNLLDSLIVRRADRIIAVSEEIYKRIKAKGIGDGRIYLVENGVNLERFSKKVLDSLKESLGIKKEALVVGTIGSLSKEKGHLYLMKAIPKVVQKVPKTTFLLIGDGRERSFLEETTSKLNISDRVIFAGTRKDIPEILSILDLFVLPSLKEGLPMSLLEAQAAKVPVVATRVGAIPNVIKNGVTGILVPSKDSATLSDAIIQILSNKKFASEMAEKGFLRIRDHFSSEKMGEKYWSIYKELTEGTVC